MTDKAIRKNRMATPPHPVALRGKLYEYHASSPEWFRNKLFAKPDTHSSELVEVPNGSLVMFIEMVESGNFFKIIYQESIGYAKGTLWTNSKLIRWARTWL